MYSKNWEMQLNYVLDCWVVVTLTVPSVTWQVNALLAKDRRNYSHDLSIQRYAVSPLSHNAGVVGWVPNTDTLHQLIRQYRETRSVRILLISINLHDLIWHDMISKYWNIPDAVPSIDLFDVLTHVMWLWHLMIQILLNIEHRLMSQAAAPCDYETLSIMQKVEVFEMSLKHTAGQDLYKVWWQVVMICRHVLQGN